MRRDDPPEGRRSSAGDGSVRSDSSQDPGDSDRLSGPQGEEDRSGVGSDGESADEESGPSRRRAGGRGARHARRDEGDRRPWYVRARPALERTVGTFAAAGIGAGLMGTIGALLLTEGGGGEYGDFVVAWAFGLVGVIAVGFLGTGLAAVTGVWTASLVRGRLAYGVGLAGGFAGQVVMVGTAAAMIAPATKVAMTGTIAVLALVSGVPAAVAAGVGVVVGRHARVRR